MTDVNQNFKVYRGDTHILHVDLTQADGSPFDATAGATLKWRLTRNPADEDDAVVRKELGSGIEAVETGGVDITLSGTDTDLPPGLYYHELKVWDSGDVATAMTGFGVVMISARMVSSP